MRRCRSNSDVIYRWRWCNLRQLHAYRTFCDAMCPEAQWIILNLITFIVHRVRSNDMQMFLVIFAVGVALTLGKENIVGLLPPRRPMRHNSIEAFWEGQAVEISRYQGRSNGGWVNYTSKISPSRLLVFYGVKMTSKRLLDMIIEFCTSPKHLYPKKNKFLATPLADMGCFGNISIYLQAWLH